MDFGTFFGLAFSYSLGLNVPLSGVRRSGSVLQGGLSVVVGGMKESLMRVGLSSSGQGKSSSG